MENNIFKQKNNSLERNSLGEKFSEEERELLELGAAQDNPLEIIKQKGKEEDEEQHQLKSEILSTGKLNPDDQELVALIIKKIEQFITGSIITDSFNKDNNRRRTWERKYLFPQASPQAVAYYQSNKLARSNFVPVHNLIDYLVYTKLLKSDIQKELLVIKDQISKIDAGYDKMELEQKLQAIQDISLEAQELLKKVTVPELKKPPVLNKS